jgi:hypothetical protein
MFNLWPKKKSVDKMLEEATGDPNYEYFKKTGTWPWDGLNPDTLNKAKEFSANELLKRVTEYADTLNEQCDEVKKTQNWSTFKVAVNDAVQEKQREVYGVEEKKEYKPWVEEPIDWKGNKTTAENEKQFNESELEKRVKKLEKKIEELILIKNYTGVTSCSSPCSCSSDSSISVVST